jgi:hypothetical protein
MKDPGRFPKRRRGHPNGAGALDQPKIWEIAAFRGENPDISATDAVKRLVEETNTNNRRRVLGKLKKFEAFKTPELPTAYRAALTNHEIARLEKDGLTNHDVARMLHWAKRYDPALHSTAPIGTLARIKQNSPCLADAGRSGWHIWRYWGDELIIRRDLRGVIPLEKHLEEGAKYFAQVWPCSF